MDQLMIQLMQYFKLHRVLLCSVLLRVFLSSQYHMILVEDLLHHTLPFHRRKYS
jgi:hypothetical protein